jgi:hypothetical protein
MKVTDSETGLVCLMHLSMYIGFELVVMPKFELNKFCS